MCVCVCSWLQVLLLMRTGMRKGARMKGRVDRQVMLLVEKGSAKRKTARGSL